jgi:hypothetical protein
MDRQGMLRASSIPIMTVLSLALISCGTNLPWLIGRDSRMVAEADRAVSAAEPLGTGLEQPVYDAETAKNEACKFIYDEMSERMGRKPRFAEQFRTDRRRSSFCWCRCPMSNAAPARSTPTRPPLSHWSTGSSRWASCRPALTRPRHDGRLTRWRSMTPAPALPAPARRASRR